MLTGILLALVALLLAAVAVLLVMLMRRGGKRSQQDDTERLVNELMRENAQRAEAMQREMRREIQEENAIAFKALAAELMQSQVKELRESNSRQMDALLRPLAENLGDFRRTVTECYAQENASRRSLADQVERLMRLNESIGTEARNLTSALKGDSKVQGDWGEMVLTTLLEQAGLEEGIHFVTQATRDEHGHTLRDEQGRLQRPDVIVNLPEGRKIVVDSKTSLTAYAEACAATDDEELRSARIRDHVTSLRRHIDELAAKRYDQTVAGSADYVMMFVPNEGAYMMALQAESELWQYAFRKGVALVSPAHLYSVMQIISQLWMQDKQNRHTLEIARKGGALYDKVMLFMQSFEDVGTALAKARTSYDTALSRLASGKGNLAKLSRDLRDLGVKAEKSMPRSVQSMLDADDSTDEPGRIEHQSE